MNKMKLGDILEIQPKSKIKAGEGITNGKYPFYTCSNELTKSINTADYEGDALIMGTGGMASIHYEKGKFSTSTDCLVYKSNKNVNLSLINKYLRTNIYLLENGFKGAGLRHISRDYISNITIPLPERNQQDKIVTELDLIEKTITNHNDVLKKYDTLIKSRFIEMFGDPVKNSLGWEVRKLKETTDIITGNTPSRKDKENYGTFIEWIKTDNITDKTYVTTAAEYLSEKGEMLGRTVEAGSILMACIAGSLRSIGRVALTDRKVAFNQQINAIVPKKYNSLFLYVLFQNTQSYAQSTVNMALKGILSKGKLEELEYIIPPIELQNNFAAFVQQIDKSKFVVQQSLEKAETLYKSLMQEYFG